MALEHPTRTCIILMFLLLALFSAPTTSEITSADCEEDLVEMREDLNATQRELRLVKEERDEFAQRLEDSTTILIIVMVLLIGSYFVFYLNTRRAKIALLEFQKEAGVNIDGTKQKPRKRRRG